MSVCCLVYSLCTSEKAGLLVTGIKDKVKLDPKKYHKFVDHLSQDMYRRMYRDIVEILDDEEWTPLYGLNVSIIQSFHCT